MNLVSHQAALQKAGVVFTEGLSDAECNAIEARGRFVFPPDLRAFLQAALPVSHGFVDWRALSDERLANYLDAPFEGIAFDIEVNVFWLPEWGPRPDVLDDAVAIARAAFDAAPGLIPILGHRYIPDRPREAGNPVFSVVQTDIIVYGASLAAYGETEFPQAFDKARNEVRDARVIEVWSRVGDGDDAG